MNTMIGDTMNVKLVVSYGEERCRIALWVTETQEYVVTNGFTGKCLSCLGIEHGLFMFDTCISKLNETEKFLS